MSDTVAKYNQAEKLKDEGKLDDAVALLVEMPLTKIPAMYLLI